LFASVFIGHRGAFLRHNNIFIELLTTPAPCVSCNGQAACRAFDKGNNTSGLALQNLKVPAVPEAMSGCVVAQEKPPVPLLPIYGYSSSQ
jgi:hypothetical protein